MAPRFDITRVRLRNYKSIESCDVELGPLTLLVGPNGSGKSNFLDALQFVADALNTNLENAFRERGGFRTVSRFGDSEIEIEITVGSGEQQWSYRLALAPGGDSGYRVIGEASKARLSEWVELVAPGRLALPYSEPDHSDFLLLEAISGFRSVSPIPERMREVSRPDLGEQLLRDGSNAPNVIAKLAAHDPASKQLVDEYMRLVVDGLVGVESRPISSWRALFFRQEAEDAGRFREFDALSMSDGTLHALGVLAALFEGTETVGIEEPESGLHPAAAAVLMDALRDGAHRRQVIVTTHSPDLLDVPGLEPSEVLAVRSRRGRTVVGRLNDAGTYALKESLYSPGSLMRTDYLQPETEE
jgi:predicted ATPase